MYNPNLGDSRYYQDQVAKIENGGLFNKDKCTDLTKYALPYLRKLFEMYDDNKDGILETITAGKMLMDLYRAMNK
jgi:hypothetical protein